jgi:hypothetical protein
MIAAAGNSNLEEEHYPSSYHGVVSIGSVAKDDSKAWYSTYGNTVDISAPGGDQFIDGGILSTVPDDDFANLQGTSMASPLVSGLTALIKSYKPTYSNSKIIELLLANADNIDNKIPGFVNKLGFGRINAFKSLNNLNAQLSKKLKLAKIQDKYIPDQGSFQPGDIFEIVDKFGNFNPLYGSSNLSYELTTMDTNLIVLMGSGMSSVAPDADFRLNSLQVQANPNISSTTATGTLMLKFTSDYGILGDSIFYININILNFDNIPKAYAYVAWGWDIDPVGPVSLHLNQATNLTFLSGQDKSPVYALSGTWFEGKWYAFEDNFDFVTYDTTDGSRAYLGNPGVEIDGLAYDPTTNLLWGVGNSSLYIVNTTDGSLTFVQNIIPDLYLINLACDKNGNLFAIDINYNYMVFIDKFTGTISPVAALTDDYDYSQGMTYDFNTDLIFAATENANGVPTISYFDFSTGTMNKISDIQNNDEITALIIPNNYKPNKVNLISPHFTSSVMNSVTFEWEPYSGTTNYNLYLADNPDFKNYTKYTTTNSSLTISDIGIQKVYWIVEAFSIGASEWSGTWYFKHTDQYCLPVNNICDEYISEFEIGSFENSSDCGITNGYSNYSDQIIDVYQNVDYQVHIFNPTPYEGDFVGVWIDYNNDGDLSENEMMELQTEDFSHFTGTLNIPTTVNPDLVRLRARIIYTDPLNPCSETAYGETEDYSINILPALTVSTTNVTNITFNSAMSGGNVTSDGGSPVTARGVCWSTSANPTIENSKTMNGNGLGSFTSNITGLNSKTTYHVCAYATNVNGTEYGEVKSFKTPKEGNLDVTINTTHYYNNMICVNEDVGLTATVAPSGSYTYTWSIDNVNVAWGMTFTHKFTNAGQYVVKVRAVGTGTNLGVDWIVVNVTDNCPVTVVVNDFTTCKNSTPTIYPTVFGGSGTYSYNWVPNSDFLDYSVQNATVKNAFINKEYKLYVTDAETNLQSMDYSYMSILESPSASFNKLFLNVKNSDPVDLTDEEVIIVNVSGGKSPYQYNWVNKNGIEIDPTNVNPPLGSSQYFLTVTDANGCLSIQKRLIIFRSNGKDNYEDIIPGLTGIGYMFTYPNPASDIISVFADFNTEMPATLKIFNLLGNSVFTMTIDNTKVFEQQINVSSLSSGVYTIVIETTANTYAKQFVKK